MQYLREALNEWSKSDAIPEINRMGDHLAVFMFGTPASGKTTFIRSFFGGLRGTMSNTGETRNISNVTTPSGTQFKVFNTDSVSKLLTGDENVYRPGTTNLVLSMIDAFTRGGGNFIFDSTGNSLHIIQSLVNECRARNYKVIFIHMVADPESVARRNTDRSRSVSAEYLQASLSKVKTISNTLASMSPDNYYIILNADEHREFYKRVGGKFLVRNRQGSYEKTDSTPLNIF